MLAMFLATIQPRIRDEAQVITQIFNVFEFFHPKLLPNSQDFVHFILKDFPPILTSLSPLPF